MTYFENAADDLTAALRRAERALVRMKACVTVSVPFEGGRLGFGKLDGRWGLCLVHTETQAEYDLFSSALDVRMNAAAAVPALVDEILRARDRRYQALRESARKLDIYSNELERAIDDPKCMQLFEEHAIGACRGD